MRSVLESWPGARDPINVFLFPAPCSVIVGVQELEALADFLLCSLFLTVRVLVNSFIISDLNPSVLCETGMEGEK